MVLEQGHIIERGSHDKLIEEKENTISYILEELNWSAQEISAPKAVFFFPSTQI